MSARTLVKFLALVCVGAFLIGLASGLTGCADAPSHNAHGGYIPACGDEPPLVGDDC